MSETWLCCCEDVMSLWRRAADGSVDQKAVCTCAYTPQHRPIPAAALLFLSDGRLWNKRCKLQLELSNSPHRIATAALVQISRSRCTTLDAGVTLQEAAAWLLEVRTNVWRVSSVLTRVPFERRQIQQHNQLRQRKNQALSVDRLIIFITCFKLNIEIEVEGNTIAFATSASCNVRRLFRRTLQRDN